MLKKIVVALLIIAVLVAAIAIPLHITNEREQREMEEARQTHLELLYHIQNRAFFGIVSGEGRDFPGEDRYIHLTANPSINHIDGISYVEYVSLALFRREAGSTLTYEQVIDYLSQEFEDDGEIRTFDNGRHPMVDEYIFWQGNNSMLLMRFGRMLIEIYNTYSEENEGFPRSPDIGLLPIAMVDALIRKEADPDYELDLTSIQNGYIEAGRAVVSEDGRTIEFIVTEHFLNRVDE